MAEEDADADRKPYKRLSSNNPLTVVLLSVAYMDAELQSILDASVVEPKALKNLNLDFSKRVILAVAIGFDSRFHKPLNVLSSIRNRFAHQVEAELNGRDAKNLFDVLAEEEKAMVQVHYRNVREPLANDPRPSRLRALTPLDQSVLIGITLLGAIKVARWQIEATEEEEPAN